MNVSWLETLDIVREVYIDNKTFFMRLVHVVVGGTDVYMFTPPCKILSNASQVLKYNDFDLNMSANLSLTEIRRIAKKLKLTILKEHTSFVELAHAESRSRVKLIINIADVDRSTIPETNPILPPNSDSLLEDLRTKRRTASYLKFFALFAQSNRDELVFEYAGGNHVYDTSTRSVENRSFITPDFKLIINDNELEPKLRQFVEVSIRNNGSIVKNFKNKVSVDFFTHVVELENTHNTSEVLFSSMDNAMEYAERHKLTSRVSHELLPHSLAAGPFYFSVQNFADGRLFIAQPVISQEDGLNTLIEWELNGRNSHVVNHIATDYKNPGYTIYTENKALEGSISNFTVETSSQGIGEHILVKNLRGKMFAMLPQSYK